MTPDGLPEYPVFARHLAVQVVEGQGVVLLGRRDHHVLSGLLHERLAVALQAGPSADVLVDLLGEEFPLTEVFYTLMALAQAGLLVEKGNAAESDEPRDAFFDSLGVRSAAATDATVAITAVGGIGRQLWVSHINQHGFTVDDGAPLKVVLASDYLDPALREVNAGALERGVPWLLCRPVGTEIWVGPLFRPGSSACWECLRDRLDHTQPVRAFLARLAGAAPPVPSDAAPWTEQVAVGLVVTQLARILRNPDVEGVTGVLARFDTVTLTGSKHYVQRRPQCPACGDPTLMARRAEGPPALQSQLKHFTADGGHRSVAPEVTIARLTPFIDPLTGVVAELRRIPYDDPAIHVYMSGLNSAALHHDLEGLSAGLRRSSSGKGFTDAQARASALGEAVERHSALFQGDEPRIRATYQDIKDDAVHPTRCLHFSANQYSNRSAAQSPQEKREWIPVPFDERATIDWSPIWSMSAQRIKYLPTTLLYVGHQSGDHPFGLGDSNGNAAGNTLEEAVLQGFLELVERDSTAMWWYNRVQRPAVNIPSLGLDGWDRMERFYERIDRDVWLLDVTSDLGVPVFVAVSKTRSAEKEDILLGLGAHLDPRIAASRAISEMNQMLAALEALREGPGVNHTLSRWLTEATVANQPYLAPQPGVTVQLSDFSVVRHDDLLHDIHWCQRRVEALGLEMLVLDQTRPDINLPVVKVVVPDLRHFRPRFAPGRLYSVPASLGWVPHPFQESELNPIPFFL